MSETNIYFENHVLRTFLIFFSIRYSSSARKSRFLRMKFHVWNNMIPGDESHGKTILRRRNKKVDTSNKKWRDEVNIMTIFLSVFVYTVFSKGPRERGWMLALLNRWIGLLRKWSVTVTFNTELRVDNILDCHKKKKNRNKGSRRKGEKVFSYSNIDSRLSSCTYDDLELLFAVHN